MLGAQVPIHCSLMLYWNSKLQWSQHYRYKQKTPAEASMRSWCSYPAWLPSAKPHPEREAITLHWACGKSMHMLAVGSDDINTQVIAQWSNIYSKFKYLRIEILWLYEGNLVFRTRNTWPNTRCFLAAKLFFVVCGKCMFFFWKQTHSPCCVATDVIWKNILKQPKLMHKLLWCEVSHTISISNK